MSDLGSCAEAKAVLGQPIRVPFFTKEAWVNRLRTVFGVKDWTVLVVGPNSEGIFYFSGVQEGAQKLLTKATLQAGNRRIDVLHCSWPDE